MKKKIIITIIVILIIISGGYIGSRIYKSHKRNTNPVDVYSVSYFEGYGMMDTEMTYSGSVYSNSDQRVIIDAEKTLDKVYASEGDAVEAGDTLLTYDTTKDSLELDSLYSQLSVYNTNMIIAKKALTKLQNTTPIEDSTASDADIIASVTDADGEQLYTKSELETAIAKKRDEINSIQNSIDNENLTIKKKERTISKGTVVAESDGEVIKVDTSEENIAAGGPAIIVSSEGTYSTTISVGELDVDNISIGDEASIYCYDTGEMYYGKVVDIGTSPNGTESYPVLASTYPVKISISDAEGLTDDAYVDVTLGGGDYEESAPEIMLPMYLLKKDGSKYYVMKEEDGRLVKQYLETGKIYYGTTVVIKSGITTEDYIAFPYLKEAVEGKITKHSDEAGLY